MTCGGCAASVKRILESQVSVFGVEISCYELTASLISSSSNSLCKSLAESLYDLLYYEGSH